MIPNVPHLHPDAWKGQGIALQKQNGLADLISPRRFVPPPPSGKAVEINIKKRKLEDVLNFGVGNPMYKTSEMYEIEKVLPFLNYDADANPNLPFEVNSIKKTPDGKSFSVNLALKGGKSIGIKHASLKSIQMENAQKVKRAFKLHDVNNGKQSDIYIDDKTKLGPGHIWTITNTSQGPLYINFVFA